MSKNRKMPWYQREYEEMLRERKNQPGYQPARIIGSDRPKPKLSDVLKCARLAKEQPEIWELAKAHALIPPEEWDHDMDHLMPSQTGPFYKLFMYNNGLQDHLPLAFGAIGAILVEWAKPGFDGDDISLARRQIHIQSWYIDDIADKDGGKS